jgi:hypothetical protein
MRPQCGPDHWCAIMNSDPNAAPTVAGLALAVDAEINAANVIFVGLVKCLLRNGALLPGQIEGEIAGTIRNCRPTAELAGTCDALERFLGQLTASLECAAVRQAAQCGVISDTVN